MYYTQQLKRFIHVLSYLTSDDLHCVLRPVVEVGLVEQVAHDHVTDQTVASEAIKIVDGELEHPVRHLVVRHVKREHFVEFSVTALFEDSRLTVVSTLRQAVHLDVRIGWVLLEHVEKVIRIYKKQKQITIGQLDAMPAAKDESIQ